MDVVSFRPALFVSLLLISAFAFADDFVLTLQNNQFSPRVLVIPADQKVKVIIKNLDPTPAEFESSDLNREKIIAASSEVTLFIGPLTVGYYSYCDDFHRHSTTGVIQVK